MLTELFLKRLEEASEDLSGLYWHSDGVVTALCAAYDDCGDVPYAMFATHNLSNGVYYYCDAIRTMLHFLHFQRECANIDRDLLRQILDPESVSIDTKRKLLAQGLDARKAIDLIETVRELWFSLFDAQPYSQVSNYVAEMVREKTIFP